MTAARLHTRSFLALLAVGSLGLAACGSENAGAELPAPPSEQPGSDPVVDPIDEPSEQPASDPVVEPIDEPVDEPVDVGEIVSDGVVIGSANMGGTIVDAKPHSIGDIAIAESFPEQLVVRFMAGDANCLAATATATASGDEVIVSLNTGITEDALTKSCLAGDVAHTLSIALDEGLNGRSVVTADA